MTNEPSKPMDLDKLERRAQTALNGYTADVNITCYVYGADVLTLVREVRRLREKVQTVAAEIRHCMTDNGRLGAERLVNYDPLGYPSVKKLCTLLGVEPGAGPDLK